MTDPDPWLGSGCGRRSRSRPAGNPRAVSEATGSLGKEGRSPGFRSREDRSGQHEEKQRGYRGDEHHTLELGADRAVEGACRLIEIHDLDDPEIVKGRDDAGDDADDGEPSKLCIDRREKDVELGEEAGSRWNSAQREHE